MIGQAGDGTRARSRYSTVAIALHWLIALAIVWNLWIGIWMGDAIADPARQAAAYRAFQFHKSLGLTILVLSLVRLAWRLTHRPPAMPAHIPGWQRSAARLTHILLYALMILVPLSGWVYVSTGWDADSGMAFSIPTVWFGLFEWPHLPGSAGRQLLAELAVEAHEIMAFAMIALLVLHVLAALKHHFLDRDAVLWSMLPLLHRPRAG